METKGRASKVCVIISGPTLHEAREQVRKASSKAGLLEFRIDQFSFTQPEAVQHLMESTTLPVIFTLRRRAHGGEFSGTRLEHFTRIKALAALHPAYLDLEYDIELDIFNEMRRISPKIQLICSYHDFEHTPKELKELLEFMQEKQADIYKIATMANSSLDMMRLMRFLKDKVRKGVRLVVVALGDRGVASRILGAVYGNEIYYAILTEALKVAPGQLTADVMNTQYRIDKINDETKVLCLIGDPICYSRSHETHNRIIRELGLNAVYVKCQVNRDELHEFLDHAKKIEIHGLSVTMPLKESVLGECTSLSDAGAQIGAINTLTFKSKILYGDNTDAKGALDVIEERISIAGKHVVIIGAGGTAKAVAYEAHRRGAKITVLNRSVDKAEAIAEDVDGAYESLEDFGSVARKGYDVLVNCTPFGMVADRAKVPIDYTALLPGRVVLDVVVTEKLSPFLVEALSLDCEVIPGIEMFVQQAIEQFAIWFHDEVDRKSIVTAFKKILVDKQDFLVIR